MTVQANGAASVTLRTHGGGLEHTAIVVVRLRLIDGGVGQACHPFGQPGSYLGGRAKGRSAHQIALRACGQRGQDSAAAAIDRAGLRGTRLR